MALSLSVTVTNAMVGLIAGMRKLSPRDLWIAGTSAWFIVTMLWGAQKIIFPASEFFLIPRGSLSAASSFVGSYTLSLTPTRIAEALQVLLSHTIVMPMLQIFSG